MIRTRFFTGARVYNAVLGEFIERSCAVKADPAWRAAGQLPCRTKDERAARWAAFDAVVVAHGFTAGQAQSFASSLRRSWVREHLPAQETQNLGVRAFDAVKQWHLGCKGKPRFKSTKHGLHSLAAKDGHGALRPRADAAGRLVGLQWGAGFVVASADPASTGRRGKDQQAELAEIETLIAAGKVLSTRIVRSVINGRDTYRMQLVCCGWERSAAAKCSTTAVAEQHRRLAEHRKTLHGALANRLFAHGADVVCEKLDYICWQKNFPRSVRDRAPGLLVATIRRKAESAGGDRLYEYNPKTTALSQTCLCGDRRKKPLSQRVHRCECGI
ncbi:MAG: transposase, partial [Mycobacterium sp.]